MSPRYAELPLATGDEPVWNCRVCCSPDCFGCDACDGGLVHDELERPGYEPRQCERCEASGCATVAAWVAAREAEALAHQIATDAARASSAGEGVDFIDDVCPW